MRPALRLDMQPRLAFLVVLAGFWCVVARLGAQPFSISDFTSQDVGGPPLAGGMTAADGGVDVRGSGDLGGTADKFQFAWTPQAGDFDCQARLAAFTLTDPFAKAGLMVRETLNPGSRFAAALATPGTVGCLLSARTAENVAATRTGYFPSNYPEMWLRLRRVGNAITAFAGYDGETWSELGSTTVTLSNAVYFGLAVAGRSTGTLATVSFRGIDATVSSEVEPYTPRGERLGPSSRQTPLVISEIMYHPADRADGLDGEFVELYNSDLIARDLTGFRLAGSVEFAFPDGCVLPPGGFLVVARRPADFAVVSGLTTALGPFAWAGSLPNDGGVLRLHNARGGVLLEVEYGTRPPWPAAADGAGHSLVLARPSFGEGDARAWAASDCMGGSPGGAEAVRPNRYAAVVINELLAHTDDPAVDFVEWFNHSTQAVDVSGCILTDDLATNRFRFPTGSVLQPRSYLVFDQTQLGFRLDAAGETLWLFDPDRTRIVDAVRFGAQESGVPLGRFPDGVPELRRLVAPSPGAENLPFLIGEVVINEIMYNPISGASDDEFIEVFNRQAEPVPLAGWRLTGGIDFTFPPGTVIEARGYLAVGRNRARLLANHPAVDPGRVLGDFDGALSNAGERLALTKPDEIVTTNQFGLAVTNHLDIEVDEVTYRTGGRWGKWSDGLGSSLELIDPDSDHLRPSNWADSDESGKAPWCTIEHTGRLDNGDGGSANRLQIMLQGPGECLVDDLEVSAPGGTNRLANPGFTPNITGWTIRGNHRASTRDVNGGVGDSPCLHVCATGRGDTACNRIHAVINPALTVNQEATLRARVRWLRGWPEFLLRTRGNYLEAAGRMAIPSNLGTPAARNSRAVENAGPAIFEVQHRPAIPNANEAVRVTARLSDPDGIGGVRLMQRVDPGTTTVSGVMTDDGTGADAVEGDGVYSAWLAGRGVGVRLAFWIEAEDGRDSGSSTDRFPADAPARECLVRWGDPKPFGNLGVYRLWQRQVDYSLLRSRESLANDPLDCTFAYDDGRVVYNVEMRAKGSPWHSGSVGSDYMFTFPEDDRFLGARDMALVTVGNLGNDTSLQREQAAFWIGEQMGLPVLHRRHVLFYENGAKKGQVYEDTEEPNGLYVDRAWPDGQDGDLYKIEDWFEFDDAGTSFSFSRDATLQSFTTADGSYKRARYRWSWRKRAVAGSANDYTNLFNLVTAVNLSGAAQIAQVNNLVDVGNWMGVFALQHIAGNWDAYGYNRGKNAYAYKPSNAPFGMVPWDIDMVLGSGSDGASTDIWGVNDSVISRLLNVAEFRRVYLRAFLDAVNGPMRSDNFDPIVDGRYAALVANGVAPAATAAIKSWVAQRRTYLANRIASEDTSAFAITSNGGADFSTSEAKITVTGTAPIAVETLTVNGVPMPVSWTSKVAWSMTLALDERTNVLEFGALDRQGRPLSGFSDSVVVRFTGSTFPSPQGQVVLNEIMYHPDLADAEFVEVYNRSTTATFDLSGWRLDGLDFEFAPGTLLGPNRYAVVTRDRDAFAAAYGFAVLPVGEYAGTLRNEGERLRLIRPGVAPNPDLVVDEVWYDRVPPWPTRADGTGASLQLIDARQDNWRAGNWAAAAASAPVQATPGSANSVAALIDPFPLVFLNEVQPQNTSGLADRFGERDPWIEIYNTGTTSLSLSGLYLTTDFANLRQWAFPAGASLGPRGFLVVWADGEPEESAAGELHTNFRLDATQGSVALVRIQSGAPAVMDHLQYRDQPPGLSYGSYPNGQPIERQLFHLVTPGATNTPGAPPVEVFFNEWMASNTGIVLDPADGDTDDWFELHNAGALAADLSAYTLTDNLDDPARFVVPNGTVIPAGGFLLVWADEEDSQATNGQIHANFKLSGAGEALGLYAPDGAPVDTIEFGPQFENVSEGRFPDGGEPPFVSMPSPSPGEPNLFANANRPPVLGVIANQEGDEGDTFRFTAVAVDTDADQHLAYSLLGAPAGAVIDPVTGEFSWTAAEADGPGEFAFVVRVTDDGEPPRSDSQAVQIRVRESNQPPTLDPIADRIGAEGATLAFRVAARDTDLPPQPLRFSLDPGAPEGATIDELEGDFAWIPGEPCGGQHFAITVRVADNAQPASSVTRTFNVTVTETDDPPVFAPIGLQLVPELEIFSLRIEAVDPDLSPLPVAYTIQSGPPGLNLDSATGLMTWTPTEEQGPNSFNVVIQAAEVGGLRSSSSAFSIVVSEANQAPWLAPVSDRTVAEGTALAVANTAFDADLPVQPLAFSLGDGAPAGAAVDFATGLFTWAIGGDVGPSTNRITLCVTDDTLDARTTCQSFTVIVHADPRIVINEIMYRPPASGAPYVELYNASTNTAWNVAGWRLTGAEFVFPTNTVLGPGAYLVVAQNVAQFRSAYGTSATVIGGFVDRLGTEGGAIELWRPLPDGSAALVDRVAFRATAPWPTLANGGGAALQLMDPLQDNSRVANWAARSGTSTNAPVNLVAMDAIWRYWQNAANPAVGWANRVYDDSLWPTGRALLYVENSALPAAKNTRLTIGPMSYFFRTAFTFDGNPQGAALRLNALIDDGAVCYLNGQAFSWLGMDNGVLPERNGTANRTVGNAVAEGPFTVTVSNLVVGDNVFAVEVHQNSSTSSDIVMGASLDVIEVKQESATPGYANSVRATLDPFPTVALNEVLALNSAGPADASGDRDPWIELVNRATVPASLAGCYLGNSFTTPARWAFPAGATLAPGEFRLVWADGESGESTAQEWHAGFRLVAPAGVVVLARMQNGQAVVLDYLEYAGLSADRSFGFLDPWRPTAFPSLLPALTPGAANRPPAPALLALDRAEDGQCWLTWSAVAGLRYRLEAKSDLNEPSWQGVGELQATGATAAFLDPAGAAAARFYRVVVVP